jgi:ribosomal protein S18 acetylase RimI-like enzyme
MEAIDHVVVFDGETDVTVTLSRARADDPGLVRSLLDIDIQSYAEATFSEHTAVTLSSHAAIFLLRTGNRCVGSCVFVRDFDQPEFAVMLAMGVLPGWRGRGLGEWLVERSLAELGRSGFAGVLLHVGARNQRAIKVYQECGFVLAQTLDDPTDPSDKQLVLCATLPLPTVRESRAPSDVPAA